MGKIGRNETCPCGSGLKYKRCCLYKKSDEQGAASGQNVQQVLLQKEIELAQDAAVKGSSSVKTLGVFIFFSTSNGDAWLLEVSEMDALKLASSHEKIGVELEENSKTIEVEWSHIFKIENDKFTVTAYKDKKEEIYKDYPVSEISKAIKKIKRKFSTEQLNKVHIK